MPIDISAHLPPDGDAAMRRAVSPIMSTMQGSRILAIAAQVKGLQAQGRTICNLTVGDFSPAQFHVPDLLAEKIQTFVGQGHTNYPPADGIPELKAAVAALYRDKLGLDYGADAVCVGSGARPPIYAAWRLFTKPGDRTVSFLPMWNVGYYAHFCETEHHFVPTTAENNFFPTVEQVEAQLRGTRLLCMNSPLNPTGTAIDRDVLVGIANAVVAENRRREAKGQPPVMWLYDQVYWLLTSQGTTHHNPVALVPDVAPYVVHVDAISKWLAGTGLRVGWGVLPPYLQKKMKGLVGHMGAWAPRPEQMATAWLLTHPDALDSYLDGLRTQINARLEKIYAHVLEMKAGGLPVDAISPQGAIYLSLKVDLFDHGFSTNEEIRAWMLEEAGVAVVPFQAFDLPQDSGWFRMSVGAVGLDELDDALERLAAALKRKLG